MKALLCAKFGAHFHAFLSEQVTTRSSGVSVTRNKAKHFFPATRCANVSNPGYIVYSDYSHCSLNPVYFDVV